MIVFAGLAVWAWTTRKMYNVFEESELKFWDVFLALATTGILAAIIGYFFPFVGLLIVVFLAPAVVNSWGRLRRADERRRPRGATRPADDGAQALLSRHKRRAITTPARPWRSRAPCATSLDDGAWSHDPEGDDRPASHEEGDPGAFTPGG